MSKKKWVRWVLPVVLWGSPGCFGNPLKDDAKGKNSAEANLKHAEGKHGEPGQGKKDRKGERKGAPDAPPKSGQNGEFPGLEKSTGRQGYLYEHKNTSRYFEVYLPANYRAEARPPLLVVLHGGGGKAEQMFKQHPLDKFADETGFVVVCPQGTPKGDKGNEWSGHEDDAFDDAGFLAKVIVELTQQLNLDEKRRFMVGFSGGASMTIRMASEKSDLLAGIATFAGKVGIGENGKQELEYPAPPSSPLSVMLTYGTADDNFTGGNKQGTRFSSAQEGIDWFRTQQRCAPKAVRASAGKVQTDTWAACEGGAVVQLVTVDGMGHMWPEKDQGVPGTKLVFDFFADKRKP